MELVNSFRSRFYKDAAPTALPTSPTRLGGEIHGGRDFKPLADDPFHVNGDPFCGEIDPFFASIDAKGSIISHNQLVLGHLRI